MHIRGEMTSGKWTLSGFVRSRPESLWWFEVDFWPLSVHFRRGPPPFSETKCPQVWAQKVWEWSDVYSRENGPLEGGTESSFSGTGWVLRVISDGFFGPNPCIFEGGPPPFSESKCPQVWAQKVWELIGCIFAENGPLEGGIESSFWGTGWGAKGDFMRYSYLYPYIFEWRTHTFFESTCPVLYAQQSWEWSDAYSWRNDLWKVNFKRVCKKPAGVLMVIWSGFLAPKRSFFEGGPPPFSESTCPQVWAQKVGNDRMYIRGEWALRRWHWIKFQWYRLGC